MDVFDAYDQLTCFLQCFMVTMSTLDPHLLLTVSKFYRATAFITLLLPQLHGDNKRHEPVQRERSQGEV